MTRFLLILFLITGCAVTQKEKKVNFSEIEFSENLSFEEFKVNLEKYANDNPYPDIDN